jgi:hypothetical protein
MPFARVSSADAMPSVALERTPPNLFSAITSSFHEYSYACGVAVPAAMSWNCPPMTSAQASLSRASGYCRAPSQAAATDAFSAASASFSLSWFHRFWYACEVSEPAE